MFASGVLGSKQVLEIRCRENLILDHYWQAAQLSADRCAICDKEAVGLVIGRHNERNSGLPHVYFGRAFDPLVLYVRTGHAAI